MKYSAKNIDNGDTQLILKMGQRYLTDYYTFNGQKLDNNDLEKLLKITEKVDLVTITNSKFMNHRYGLIFGHLSNDETVINIYNNYSRINMMYNLYDNFYVRGSGLMRFGKFHVFNNYISNYHLGLTIGYKSKMYM